MKIFRSLATAIATFAVVIVASSAEIPTVRAASQSFTTVGTFTWTVPAGVTSISITAQGASGSPGLANVRGAPGLGGIAFGKFTVTPGASLQINVGGVPAANANGSGNGGIESDVRIGGTTLNDRKIVGGGGGGGGGAGLNGVTPYSHNMGAPGGDAGSIARAGSNAYYDSTIKGGGSGGLSGPGGPGGTGGTPGSDANMNVGGAGGVATNSGGGGGGGYRGGGGGAGAGNTTGGAGGGAGSTWVDTNIATNTSLTTASAEGDGSVVITYALPVTATLVSSNSTPTYGDSITLTATVSNSAVTGTVTFKDGATTIGTASPTSGVATFSTSSLAVGTHSLSAVYGGDSNYGAATTSSMTVTVSAIATTTALSPSVSSAASGASITLTGTISPSAATGTITFKDGTTIINTCTPISGTCNISVNNLTIGSHTLTAVYGGGGNYSGSTSSQLTVTIAALATTINFTSVYGPVYNEASVFLGTAAKMTATVSPSDATGTVTFKDGTTTLGTCTLVSATCNSTYDNLSITDHTFTAEYSGDASHAASTASTTAVSVVQAAPSVSAVTTTVPATAKVGKKLAKGKKARLKTFIKPTAGAKLQWKAKGGCKVSGTYLVAPKKVTTCTLTLKQTVTKTVGGKKKSTVSTSSIAVTVF